MKRVIIFFIGLLICSGCSMQTAESQNTEEKRIIAEEKVEENPIPGKESTAEKQYVLVELFTSEGCSSCPPADKVLARLKSEQPVENVEIVPLALHVDYWNYLGWRDEFSSNAFSQRQSGYAERFKLDSIYTPQMVVDGQNQFVGSNFETAVGSIKESAKTRKASVELAVLNGNLNIKINELPAHDVSNVWLAITEDNLQTDVRRGENSGKKLPHAAVARNLKLIGNIAADKKSFVKSENLTVPPEWKNENVSLVVFVQGQNSKNVFAVGKKKLL